MTAHRIDKINIGLILLSFALAYSLPVQVFLFSYAVLGPLHYMTEIGWLDKRNFFANDRRDVWILAGLTGILTTMVYLAEFVVTDNLESQPVLSALLDFSKTHSGGIVFFAFASALTMVFLKNKRHRYIAILIAGLISLFIHKIDFAVILFGVLVPTIIHVSIFTMFFMLYGALKSRSAWGISATILFAVGCILIFFIHKDPDTITATEKNFQMLLDSTFVHIGAILSQFLGLREAGSDYMLLTNLGIQLQTLFAFCYTYHYLNWFSKTKVINWHDVSRKWLLFTGVIWIASLVLYTVDYKTGFMALFFLSMLHVFLEFPLNHLSIAGVFQEIKNRTTLS